VDHDPDEEPDDLLALFVGQSCVQAATYLGEQVVDLLGHCLGYRGLCGGQAGF